MRGEQSVLFHNSKKEKCLGAQTDQLLSREHVLHFLGTKPSATALLRKEKIISRTLRPLLPTFPFDSHFKFLIPSLTFPTLVSLPFIKLTALTWVSPASQDPNTPTFYALASPSPLLCFNYLLPTHHPHPSLVLFPSATGTLNTTLPSKCQKERSGYQCTPIYPIYFLVSQPSALSFFMEEIAAREMLLTGKRPETATLPFSI